MIDPQLTCKLDLADQRLWKLAVATTGAIVDWTGPWPSWMRVLAVTETDFQGRPQYDCLQGLATVIVVMMVGSSGPLEQGLLLKGTPAGKATHLGGTG